MKTKIAVLVSGGIDSYIAYKYAQYIGADAIPLFVNYGQPYLTKEIRACNKLFDSDLVCVNADLVSAKLDNIPTLDKQEIYGRNILMAFYGALIGDRVWIASLETEMNPTAVADKHPEFFHMMSALFSHVLKTKRLETVVETPFAKYTKSDIIKLALDTLGVSPELIKTTSTCYHEEHKQCGVCSTCFKRWIAMVNNDLVEEYHKHPYRCNEYGKNVVELMRKEIKTKVFSGRFSEKRLEETDRALIKSGFEGIF